MAGRNQDQTEEDIGNEGISTSQWSSQDITEFPKVWRRFTGKKPMPDGRLLKYRIQDIPEELEDAVVDHMLLTYLKNEPLHVSLRTHEDPLALQETEKDFRKVLENRISHVALLETEEPNENSKIVGVHFFGRQKRLEEYEFSKSKKIRAMEKLACYVGRQIDVYEKYGVDEICLGFGLSVDKEYRGQGIGLELLRAKHDFCGTVDLEIAVMVCTSIEAQILVEKAGYDLLVEVPYDEYIKNGEVVFRTSVPSLKYYAKKIP